MAGVAFARSHTRVLLLCAWVAAQPTTASADELRPSVAGVVLPTRRGDLDAIRARATALAETLAQRWHGSVHDLGREKPLALAPRIDAAQQAADQVALDDAAARFDGVLEDGAHAPYRIDVPAAFVAAAVRRSAIAFSRQEVERGEALLERLIHYDGSFALTQDEQSPVMRSAFARVAGRIGEVDLTTELRAACADTDVVVLVRPVGAEELEVSRWDACKRVASVRVPIQSNLDAGMDVLASQPPPRIQRETGPRPGRAHRTAGLIVGLGGIAVTGVGTYVAIRAAGMAHINDGCSNAMPCAGELIEERKQGWRNATIGAVVLVATGAAAIATGVVLYRIGVRKEHAPAVTVAPIVGGGVVAWRSDF